MKQRTGFLMTFVLVGLLTFTLILSAYAAGEVSLAGKLNNGGKRITADDGQEYTIIPDESIEGKMPGLDGKRVKLTGVVYTSHGRKMITAYSMEILQ